MLPAGQARTELLPTGVLRFAVNVANPVMARRNDQGAFEGQAIALSRRLADDLGIPVEIVPFPSGGAILDRMDRWDVAVLAVDPTRLDRLFYLPPFFSVDATLAAGSAIGIRRCEEADMPGWRIATARNAAYETHLRKVFSRCEIVSHSTPAEAIAAFVAGDCHFVAGIRQTLEAVTAMQPDSTLLEDNFLVVPQAIALPIGRGAARTILSRWWPASVGLSD